MREQIYNLFANQSDMTWEQILMNLCAAALLGFLIFISYGISHRGTIYSKKFNASLVALTVLTGTVMTVIGSTVTFLVLLLLGCIKSDNRMLLIIRTGRSKQSAIQSQVFKMFKHKAVLRVRNTSESHVEFIYEITQKLLHETEKKENNVCDAIYALGDIEYVNVVMQNDEVSN